MANISFYGSHNATVVVENNGEILCVIEVERFLNVKNSGYSQYLTAITRPFLLKEIVKWINKKFGISEFDTCFYMNTDTVEGSTLVHYHNLIPAKNYIGCSHHLSHAACGFYQSDFHKSLIVSFDGGGNDGFFNIYYANSRENIEHITRLDHDLGFPYMVFGDYFNDIKKELLGIGVLVYPGKVMGLCSYGNLNNDWLEPIKIFYKSKVDGSNYIRLLNELSEKINITFDVNQRLEGQLAWDLAKTSQIAFEEVFIELISPYLEKYPSVPLILVGGCGLNILLNTRLKTELNREVFIPPNPNDCGIASGMILNHIKPKRKIDLTYSGIPILDEDMLMSYCESHYHVSPVNIKKIASDIVNGKIIGVVRGTSEHGPRALGNRSIICDPTKTNMKDILNEKVKNREWYRPFAPVVRLEDVSKYFDFYSESRWMQFCPKVRDEWRETLPSITHVDGTARVQTVTREQNPFIYDLITEVESLNGVGVLLNTSFNVGGKPILSSIKDAMTVFYNTKMDNLLINDYYFEK